MGIRADAHDTVCPPATSLRQVAVTPLVVAFGLLAVVALAAHPALAIHRKRASSTS